MRSNQPRELAVIREVRLGDRKLVFRFSKILACKKHSRLSDPSKFHWYACSEGAKNVVRVRALVSKKFGNRLQFD